MIPTTAGVERALLWLNLPQLRIRLRLVVLRACYYASLLHLSCASTSISGLPGSRCVICVRNRLPVPSASHGSIVRVARATNAVVTVRTEYQAQTVVITNEVAPERAIAEINSAQELLGPLRNSVQVHNITAANHDTPESVTERVLSVTPYVQSIVAFFAPRHNCCCRV